MKPTHSLIACTILSVGVSISCQASNLRESTEIESAQALSNLHSLSSSSASPPDFSHELAGAPLVKSYEQIVADANPEDNADSTKPQLPVLKSGRDMTGNAEAIYRKRQKEAFQKMYEEFEKNLINEAVTEVPKRHQSHIDKFNAKMEILPDGIEEVLPESLRLHLNRKIFILKSDNRGNVHRIMLSMVRLLNEYVGLKPDDSSVDFSHKMGRFGFKLKDSVILGLNEEEMRDLAGQAFQIAAEKGKDFVETLDYVPAIADASISSAQSFYWAASLIGDPFKSKQLLEKAKELQQTSQRHIKAAPFQERKNLIRVNMDLTKKISSAESYFSAKEKAPSLPSLYSWNKTISEIQNAILSQNNSKTTASELSNSS